MLRSTQKQL